MSKTYMRHPVKPTPLARRVLRARLSLKETQDEFALRFMVSKTTIHNWESGKSRQLQRVHTEMLERLTTALKAEGRYMPEELFNVNLRAHLATMGNAYDA